MRNLQKEKYKSDIKLSSVVKIMKNKEEKYFDANLKKVIFISEQTLIFKPTLGQFIRE